MKNNISRRQFLKNTTAGTALLGIGSPGLLIQACSKSAEFDLVIKGGLIFDGLGNPGKEMDLAIKGDKILVIAKNIKEKKALNLINAKGYAVSPGFIDPHTHTDTGLLVNPKAESYIRQGITSCISGNCGYSPFPYADEIYEESRSILKEKYNIDLNWTDIIGFLKRIEEKGTAINYGTLIGHGAIRGKVVGLNDIDPSAGQIMEMRQIIAESMKAGALGLSTGLEYSPGSYAKTEEITELCYEVARYNGVYATHMRDEGDRLLESVEEALDVARQSGVNLQLSHLKVSCSRNWNKIDALIKMIEEAKTEGINILADRYSYIAASTGLSYFFPLWAQQGTSAEYISRLKDPSLDKKLRSFVKESEIRLGSWDKVLICDIYTEKNKHLEGKYVLEASVAAGKDPYEFMRDLIIEEKDRVGMISFMMNEDNLKRILAHPLVIPGSDGSAVAPYGLLNEGKPHPRFYGTFPRVLGKYVREDKIMSLEEAIKKMTSVPVEKFKLGKRGRITENYFADLVIFDPDKVIDKATWEDPHQYPAGIDYVVVNGKLVIKEEEHTGELPGRILGKV